MVVEQIERLPGLVPVFGVNGYAEKLLSAEGEKALFLEVEAGRMADLAQRCLLPEERGLLSSAGERVYLPSYDGSEEDPEDPEKRIPHLKEF